MDELQEIMKQIEDELYAAGVPWEIIEGVLADIACGKTIDAALQAIGF